MTRYAITADSHGHPDQLQAAIADAQRRGVTAFIDLGDVGTDPCYDLLRQVNAQVVFGNYEVTKWGNLSPENQLWVHELKPMLVGETFLAAHAAPYLPAGVHTVDDVLDYILEHNVKWRTLYPRMDEDEDTRWLTYAQLEEHDKRIFFHGHTHRQMVWRIGPSGVMSLQRSRSIVLDTRARYIVGVGSVGQPQDGSEPQYVIYDRDTETLTLTDIHPTTH